MLGYLPDSQLYFVYLLKSTNLEDSIFQFSFKQSQLLRPKAGDTITNPLTFQSFKILHDVPNFVEFIRITHDPLTRVTSTGAIRVTGPISTSENVSHNYYVTPANNPNRISSYTTSRFANDQTLKQLFR